MALPYSVVLRLLPNPLFDRLLSGRGRKKRRNELA